MGCACRGAKGKWDRKSARFPLAWATSAGQAGYPGLLPAAFCRTLLFQGYGEERSSFLWLGIKSGRVAACVSSSKVKLSSKVKPGAGKLANF